MEVTTTNNLQSSPIPLQSSVGQQLWNTCTIKNEGMIEHYIPNNNAVLSGPASLALLLNAISVAYRIKYSNLETKEERDAFLGKLHNSNERITISIEDVVSLKALDEYLAKINVKDNGMTLLDLNIVGTLLGFGTVMNYVRNDSLGEVQQQELQNVLKGDNDRYVLNNPDALKSFLNLRIGAAVSGIIANYDSSVLGLDTSHASCFGAIAGYHDGKVLVMDYGSKGPVWVDADLLFEVMTRVDSRSGIPMGMVSIYELLF